MNIYDLEKYTGTEVVRRAEALVRAGKVENPVLSYNEKYYYSYVQDGRTSCCPEVTIEDNGDIADFHCCQKTVCPHVAALILKIRPGFKEKRQSEKDRIASDIINICCRSEKDEEEIKEPEHLEIVPYLLYSDGVLKCSLKIGSEKMYAVTNYFELKRAFETNGVLNYGKTASFRHSYSLIDEKSKRLLDFMYFCYTSESDELKNQRFVKKDSSKRNVSIIGTRIDSFFSILKDDFVSMNGTDYYVKFENPNISFDISENSDDGYSLRMNMGNLEYYGFGKRMCFIDEENNCFFISDEKYSSVLAYLVRTCSCHNYIYVSRRKMPEFYGAVLRKVSEFCEISGLDMLDEYIPPQPEAKIYLDCIDDGIAAELKFFYGDKSFEGFYDKKTNPFCDRETEKKVERLFLKYFPEVSLKKDNKFFVKGNEGMVKLLAGGISELKSEAEVFVSESFGRLKLRPAVTPAIGIRPSGNLLELEITAEGYTVSELAEMVKLYRKGAKYHRFTDGSFAVINDAFSEITDIADDLGISDKNLSKGVFSVPKFRMLYLDSLKKTCENIRIDRSKEFKKAVREYGSLLEDQDTFSVPEALEDIMREYQKYGFRWMKTIARYGFGGILADDMGLGKTLQAISLIQSELSSETDKKLYIIVCPSSLTLNWENEFKKFAPKIRTAVLNGSVSGREELISDAENYDVLITSYTLLTRDISKYKNISFSMEFIDEAQYIKNQNTQAAKAVKAVKAETRFALTGTPVENSLAELWSIFDYLMPDYLHTYTYFRKNFEAPITAKNDKKAVSELQKLISPFVLRRMKKEVLKELPEKTETIMHAVMEEEQSRLYSAHAAEIRKTVSKGFSEQQDRIKILSMITRLRQICCDPALVYDNFDGESSKLEQCMLLLENCIRNGHKILLFSQFTSMLDIIAKRLIEEGISYYVLAGKTRPQDRIKLVNRFNSDSTSVFLISLKAGGTGLNLTGADIVIHYDPWWNSSAENQASDRAYRIGQKNNVQIYKLITDRTIEEKIIELQKKKSELYDIAVNGEQDIMHMSAEDILEILE